MSGLNNKEKSKLVEPIVMHFTIEQGDFVRAGEASSKIKQTLLQLGFSGAVIRRTAIATYEVEMNMVIHSWGGTLEAKILPDEIRIVAMDRGPGIANLDLAMEEGYSTAPEYVREMGFGAGMGLPNIRNCASDFAIESVINKGTTVTIVIRE